MQARLRRLVLLPLLATAVPALAADCDFPENLVSNCGFDVDQAGWMLSADVVTGNTVDCTTGPRCITLNRHDAATSIEAMSACVDVNPSTYFTFGGWLRLVSGVAFQGCSLSLYEYTNKVCGPGLVPSFFQRQPSGSWRELRAGVAVSAATLSVKLRLYCGDENTDFDVRVDDFFLQPAIYTDGFDAGNFNLWSGHLP